MFSRRSGTHTLGSNFLLGVLLCLEKNVDCSRAMSACRQMWSQNSIIRNLIKCRHMLLSGWTSVSVRIVQTRQLFLSFFSVRLFWGIIIIYRQSKAFRFDYVNSIYSTEARLTHRFAENEMISVKSDGNDRQRRFSTRFFRVVFANDIQTQFSIEWQKIPLETSSRARAHAPHTNATMNTTLNYLIGMQFSCWCRFAF